MPPGCCQCLLSYWIRTAHVRCGASCIPCDTIRRERERENLIIIRFLSFGVVPIAQWLDGWWLAQIKIHLSSHCVALAKKARCIWRAWNYNYQRAEAALRVAFPSYSFFVSALHEQIGIELEGKTASTRARVEQEIIINSNMYVYVWFIETRRINEYEHDTLAVELGWCWPWSCPPSLIGGVHDHRYVPGAERMKGTCVRLFCETLWHLKYTPPYKTRINPLSNVLLCCAVVVCVCLCSGLYVSNWQ